MEKNYFNCLKCKYNYSNHCKYTDCGDCEMCGMIMTVKGSYCKCTTIHYGEDCPYFVKAEEADNVKDLRKL